ncbi:hypothetical protein PoB_005583900 [Plakobranchus ocellatus]|uniref:Uncharacterized protein n=1 Tax=Plakobranchus ocellatus TaxID=259542 RepID=A0AAV4CDX4_9GAST|nr:hypothetical protein PoB_005583900 [Plakobranchus ocellatus]
MTQAKLLDLGLGLVKQVAGILPPKEIKPILFSDSCLKTTWHSARCLADNCSAIDAFLSIFTEDIMNSVVESINSFAERRCQQNNPP